MIDKTIEAFLRRDDIQEYLEQENLDAVFTEWNRESLPKYLRKFLESEVHINPLDYMREVPPGYFFNEKITNITISEGVEVLHQNCCSHLTLLSEVLLPSTIIRIFDYPFDSCSKLEKIYYNGTSDEFYNKVKVDEFIHNQEVTIHCTNASFPWTTT